MNNYGIACERKELQKYYNKIRIKYYVEQTLKQQILELALQNISHIRNFISLG